VPDVAHFSVIAAPELAAEAPADDPQSPELVLLLMYRDVPPDVNVTSGPPSARNPHTPLLFAVVTITWGALLSPVLVTAVPNAPAFVVSAPVNEIDPAARISVVPENDTDTVCAPPFPAFASPNTYKNPLLSPLTFTAASDVMLVPP